MTAIAPIIDALRRRLAADPGNARLRAEAASAVNQLAKHLERAMSWLRGGMLHEAAAYSDDCGNLAQCLVDLLGDEAFCKAIPETGSLPSRSHIEPLVMAPVEIGRDEQLVDDWITNNVLCKSLETRLASLQVLRDAQPREVCWTDQAAVLVDVALARLQDELDAVVAGGDEAAMRSMQQRLSDMGIASSNSGARAVHALERAWAAGQRVAAGKAAIDTSLAMHLAWAAMDEAEARRQRTRWQSLVEADEVDPAARAIAMGVERWLDGLKGRTVRRQHESTLVDELERGLDEERHVSELERQYAALQRQDIVIPSRVATRLKLRLADHRTARRRRWAVGMAVVAGLAAILIVAILVTFEARHREHRVAVLEQTVVRQLEADDPHSAKQTLQGAIDAGTIDEDMGRALAASIDQQLESWSNRFNVARGHHDRAVALLDEPDSETMLVTAEQALRDADAVLPRGALLDLSETREQLRLRRLAWTRARREVLAPRLTALDSVIATPLPGHNDTEAWTSRRARLAEALAELELINSEPVAAEPDVQSQLQRRRLVLTQLHVDATEHLRLLHELEQLLLALQRVPASETAWAGLWERLVVDEHASQLTHLLPLKEWNDGLSDAQAGVAVQHWREQVYPELLRAGLLGEAPPSHDLGVVADRLREHLELSKDTDSPYSDVARRLLNATSEAGGADAAMQMLSDANLENLYRVPLSTGGVLYRRGNLNADEPLAHALLSTDDLPLGASELLPADLPEGVGPEGSVSRIGSSELLTEAIAAMDGGAPASETLLNLLESLEQEDDPDGIVNPMVRLATLQAMAQLIGDDDPTTPLAVWLEAAGLSASPLRVNWPRQSVRGTRQTRRTLIRGLRRALADAPSLQTLKAAMAAPALNLQAQAGPAAPAAILLHGTDGWTVLGTMPSRAFLLQVKHGRGSQFVPLPVSSDGTVHPPPNCLPLPTLIFEQK